MRITKGITRALNQLFSSSDQSLKPRIDFISSRCYRAWELKKSDSSSSRQIEEPYGHSLIPLKVIQKELLEELEKFPIPENIYGVKGKSYVSNALAHKNSKSVLKVDIKKFYPSCTLRQLERNVSDNKLKSFILKYGEFLFYSRDITLEPYLPTGAATSALLGALILGDLDKEIIQYAKECGATYTRYIDDITFSLPDLISQKEKDKHQIEIVKKLKRYGWPVHSDKTGWINELNQPFVITGVDLRSTPKVTGRYIKDTIRPRLDRAAREAIEFLASQSTENSFENWNEVLSFLNSETKGCLAYVKQINSDQYNSLIDYFQKRLARHLHYISSVEVETKEDILQALHILGQHESAGSNPSP